MVGELARVEFPGFGGHGGDARVFIEGGLEDLLVFAEVDGLVAGAFAKDVDDFVAHDGSEPKFDVLAAVKLFEIFDAGEEGVLHAVLCGIGITQARECVAIEIIAIEGYPLLRAGYVFPAWAQLTNSSLYVWVQEKTKFPVRMGKQQRSVIKRFIQSRVWQALNYISAKILTTVNMIELTDKLLGPQDVISEFQDAVGAQIDELMALFSEDEWMSLPYWVDVMDELLAIQAMLFAPGEYAGQIAAKVQGLRRNPLSELNAEVHGEILVTLEWLDFTCETYLRELLGEDVIFDYGAAAVSEELLVEVA